MKNSPTSNTGDNENYLTMDLEELKLHGILWEFTEHGVIFMR